MAVTPNFAFPTPNDSDPVSEGAEAIRALGDAVDAQFGLGFQFVGTRYYTSSGTFAKADPFGDSSFDGAKLRAIKVTVVGGGAGGFDSGPAGGSNSRSGSGGGGGGMAQSFITNIAGLSATETVTRGAGGASTTAGGASSFGSLVAANGGGLGNRTSNTAGDLAQGGFGGSATAGDLQVRGGAGGGTPRNGANINVAMGGHGGDSGAGGGGAPARHIFDGTTVGFAGVSGGGGSGGAASANKAASNGGAGGNGYVIVDVFA